MENIKSKSIFIVPVVMLLVSGCYSLPPNSEYHPYPDYYYETYPLERDVYRQEHFIYRDTYRDRYRDRDHDYRDHHDQRDRRNDYLNNRLNDRLNDRPSWDKRPHEKEPPKQKNPPKAVQPLQHHKKEEKPGNRRPEINLTPKEPPKVNVQREQGFIREGRPEINLAPKQEPKAKEQPFKRPEINLDTKRDKKQESGVREKSLQREGRPEIKLR